MGQMWGRCGGDMGEPSHLGDEERLHELIRVNCKVCLNEQCRGVGMLVEELEALHVFAAHVRLLAHGYRARRSAKV